jgi:NAD(P)-dependent dehydrogenase (short-subunit alcohol dehydrogenase family)
MTRSIAVSYAADGVRANCICPGDIETNMANEVVFPEGVDFKLLNRIMSLTGMKGPEVVAGMIALLASDDGIHITGEEIRVDGGMLA